jgi:hypothetical protein
MVAEDEAHEGVADHARQAQRARDLAAEHAGDQQHAEEQRIAQLERNRREEGGAHVGGHAT